MRLQSAFGVNEPNMTNDSIKTIPHGTSLFRASLSSYSRRGKHIAKKIPGHGLDIHGLVCLAGFFFLSRTGSDVRMFCVSRVVWLSYD